MTHGSLFSGIGGFELGAEMSDIENVWSCEIEPYQRLILKNKFPNTYQYGDIKEITPPSDTWTSLVEVFRAKTSVLREKWRVSPESDLGCGVRCGELFGLLDLSTSSLKTLQLSLFEDSSKSYATFPRSGTMQNGRLYQMPLLDTLIGGRGYTLLPTPTKSDNKSAFVQIGALNRYLESGHQIRMMDILCQKGFTKCQRVVILEMVMGFDIGHTELAV